MSGFQERGVIDVMAAARIANPEERMEGTGQLRAHVAASTTERDDDLALAARSDVEAFGVLYERHWLAVFRYLRTRTESEDDAAELTAETFDRALAAIPQFRASGGGFLAWILRIARNASIDAHRRSRSRPQPLLGELIDERKVSDPETALLAMERHRSLAATVGRLPTEQREAIALRYAAGLTAAEIGRVLGKSEAATQKMLSRALAFLRKEYIDGR